jgi:arabinosaccharide transport system substrate-binding protein
MTRSWIERGALLVLAIRNLSVGVWVILALLLISAGALLVWDTNDPRDDASLEMWVFSPEHKLMYDPIASRTSGTDAPLEISIMSIAAIQSRMMSGFFGGLPTADLIEVERATIGQVFMGPTDAIGFTDLTPRLESEGLLEQINPPSLSPWSTDGRVFGLPHDVHPVMLAYRADITESAGIDVTKAQTWDEYFALLRPLMRDEDNDGRVDHYPLAAWYTQPDTIELLMLQGDGALFDERGAPTIDSDRNAHLLARIVSWCLPEGRVAVDIEEFSAAGHRARVDGVSIGNLCPDWMCSIWRMHVPGLDGTLKLMPLPAFEPGGRRTSVRGGTMLGIPRTTQHPEQAWTYAKTLYTSPEVARELYTTVDIITPVRSLWDDPVYDEPDPYFMGQPKGRMFIELAPEIPIRTSSPYNRSAVLEVRDAAIRLAEWAQSRGYGFDDVESIEPRAKALLARAQANIVRMMERNAFAPLPGRGDEQ